MLRAISTTSAKLKPVNGVDSLRERELSCGHYSTFINAPRSMQRQSNEHPCKSLMRSFATSRRAIRIFWIDSCRRWAISSTVANSQLNYAAVE